MDVLAAHLARLAAVLGGKHGALAELTARLAAAPCPLARLGLDRVAVEVLIAVAAPALDLALARRLAEAWAGPAPTIEELIALLAIGATGEDAVFAALAPDAPLVASGLVELAGLDRAPLARTVRIDERVVGFLRGARVVDRRLAASARVQEPVDVECPAIADIARALATPGPIVIEGPSGIGKTTAAVAALGRAALVVELELLVDDPAQLARVRREALLLDAPVILRGWSDTWPLAFRRGVLAAVRDGALLAAGDAGEPCRELAGARRIPVAMPEPAVQTALWRRALGDAAIDLGMAARYPLPPADILAAAAAARAAAELAQRPLVEHDLVRAARDRIRHRLGDVAELVTTTLGWHDLVLPDDVLAQLDELVDAVRHRERVLSGWSFAEMLPYGRTISALFSGPPGTGKTMVAGLIGKSLGLEVFRVDLARVVSKYIGETEKNLARVFDEAARCRAIVLFDEADALFAKRTEVKTANDRNANLEVNYLLQRVESHDGIVILTTNAATAIDAAFTRRLRYRIAFPAPDDRERARLWRAMVPDAAPLAGDVDFDALASRYPLAGGHIKNALVRAAFLAAGSELPALDQGTLERGAALEWLELGRLPGATPPPAPLRPRPRATPCPSPTALAQEPALLAVLASGAQPGETIEAAFRRKEHELGAVMAALSAGEARALQRRLASPRPGDELATQFARLAADRQARLLAFLGDARRRDAIDLARRGTRRTIG